MKAQKFYLTKQETGNMWNYLTDPINPTSVQETGLIEVDRSEIRVDDFGAYVTRFVDAPIQLT